MNKKLLSAAISSALIAPLAVPTAAHAVEFKLSGQVNRAVIFRDDGFGSNVDHVDNTASGTRFRLVGSEDLGNGMQVGFNWEMQTSRPGIAGRAVKDPASNPAAGLDLRIAEVWFGGNWGRLSIGQGPMASKGAIDATDLSGTWHAAYVLQNSPVSAVQWRTTNNVGPFTRGGTLGLNVGNTYASGGFEAQRRSRLRYDTPAFGPITLSASHHYGGGDAFDVAARLNTSVGGGQLIGSLFYFSGFRVGAPAPGAQTPFVNVVEGGVLRQRPVNDFINRDNVGGNISFRAAQGTNITFSYARASRNALPSPHQWFVKLGHIWGNNAASVGYGEVSKMAAIIDPVSGNRRDLKSKAFQAAFVHTLPGPKVEIYAGYHHHWLSKTGPVGTKSINSFLVGSRVRFD
jgi:hypothetical protein